MPCWNQFPTNTGHGNFLSFSLENFPGFAPHFFFFSFSDASFEKESSQKAIASPTKFPGKSAAVNIEKRKKKHVDKNF